MDKIERYRQIIIQLLTPFAESHYANADAVNELVFDREHDRYLVVSAGWEGNVRRIHSCLVHLDIIDGKVWIQGDNTEDGIGYALEAAGIPKSDIVPAFHPINVRPHTGYAVT